MEILIEVLGELILTPFLEFYETISFQKLGKYGNALKALIMVLGALCLFGIILGIVSVGVGVYALVKGPHFRLAGICLVSICGTFDLIYLVVGILLYRKQKKK